MTNVSTQRTRILTITWPSAEPVKLHDIAKVIRDLPADAEATNIETTATTYGHRAYVGLRIEYTIDTAAERRRIIDEYRNPLRTFAGIAHETRNLSTRD